LVYPSIAFFLFLIQGLFSTCISWLFTSIGFFLEVDLHTQMLVSILGFSKIPISFKHKFNPIYKQYKDDKIANQISSNDHHECPFYDALVVGGIEMEM
jgi:hypothetical protein